MNIMSSNYSFHAIPIYWVIALYPHMYSVRFPFRLPSPVISCSTTDHRCPLANDLQEGCKRPARQRQPSWRLHTRVLPQVLSRSSIHESRACGSVSQEQHGECSLFHWSDTGRQPGRVRCGYVSLFSFFHNLSWLFIDQ